MGTDMIQIVIRQPHCDPVSIEVEPASTIKDLKSIAKCVGANIRFKGEPLLNTDTLEAKGVRSGDTIHVFPMNKERTGDAKYQAQRRLTKGLTQRATAHHDLHRQTQSVIMDESQRTRATIEKGYDTLGSKCDKILAYQEKVSRPNLHGVDLMAKVYNKYNVGRMNTILQQFDVDRPSGVKKEGKASLIVKNIPCDQLLELLESPEEPKTKMAKRAKTAMGTPPPNGTLDAFFGRTGPSVAQPGAPAAPPPQGSTAPPVADVETPLKCEAKIKSGKRKGELCGAGMPCKKHKVPQPATKWHLNMSPYIPELWNPIYARFTKCSDINEETIPENTQCGWITVQGSPCQWKRPCQYHEDKRREAKARAIKGICGAPLRSGVGVCQKVRGECERHAPKYDQINEGDESE